MTPEQRIDAALDSVLKASGSALRHYTMPKTLADMREAMRKVMYPYGRDDGSDYEIDDGDRDRCAACGHVFYLDDELPEDDDEC